MSAGEEREKTAAAVRELGALPVPVGPEPQAPERDRLRAAFVAALANAHHTHPCPEYGHPNWTGCVHYDEAGRVVGVGSCHNERRADAVLTVRDTEMESLRARVAELEAERHETNEALDDAVQALRTKAPPYTVTPEAHAQMRAGLSRYFAGVEDPHDGPLHHDYLIPHDLPETGRAPRDPKACDACGDLPEQWCPDCAACRKGCFGGFDGNDCPHTNAPWPGRDLPETGVQSADRVVAYRNPELPSVLLCREHGEGCRGLTPITSEDLPDGGGCTFGDPDDPDDVCGRDVLIDPESGGTR